MGIRYIIKYILGYYLPFINIYKLVMSTLEVDVDIDVTPI